MACLGLVLAAPLVTSAKTKAAPIPLARYSYQSGFPVPNSGAPDYPYIDVTGVCEGHDGRIYITQGRPSQDHVLVFNQAGQYLFEFGNTELVEPHTIRCDPDGNLWVTDYYTNQVTKWTPNGQLIVALGVRGKGSTAPGRFEGPNDVAFGRNRDVFVAEGDGARVSHLTLSGSYLNSWRNPGKKPQQLGFPHSIAVDARGLVYVADRKNKAVKIFDANGNFINLFKNSTMGVPWGLWITPDQRLFVCNGNQGRITLMDLNGNVLSYFGKGGKGAGLLHEAHQICVDASGALYEADASGKRVQKFVPY